MVSLQVTCAANLCAGTLLIAWLLHWVYKWMNPPCKGICPPGSMGLPIVGESIQFFKTSYSLDIPDFYKLRLKRYGPIFKTSLVGQPVVVSADPEVNRFIFQQEGKLFRIWYPEAANIIIGKETVNGFYGHPHKFIRNSISKLLGLEYLKQNLIPQLEVATRDNFAEWATKYVIDVHDSTPDGLSCLVHLNKKIECNNAILKLWMPGSFEITAPCSFAEMIIDLVANKLVSLNPSESRELSKNYNAFLQGLISFPLYVPGTTFYQCMQGRKNMQKIMSDLISKRLTKPDVKHGDFLDLIVEELQSGKPTIDEKFATDALVALLFTSIVTLPTILILAFKFLGNNPKVLKALQEEHEAIVRNRGNANSGFTWEEYKSLTFTTMVVNELTRMSNTTPGIFRKTVEDVQLNGYTIPTGWLVMVCPMAVHLNPEVFEDPLSFNPWRWQDESQRSTLLKNFIPFGLGIRACPAADFSKLFTAIFLHVLVTNYRWKEISDGEVARMGVIRFPNGYKIQLIRSERI